MKLYKLDYDSGSIRGGLRDTKYYESLDNAKAELNRLVHEATKKYDGLDMFGTENTKNFIKYVWLTKDEDTYLDVTISDISTED